MKAKHSQKRYPARTATAFKIGFELLPDKIDAAALVAAVRENPSNSCRLDILVAGLTEIVETRPAREAARQIQAALSRVAVVLG